MGLVVGTLEGLVEVIEQLDADEARIVMLGLDGASKSTILQKLTLQNPITTLPTVGFNVETISPMNKVSFTVWDVGGQQKIRPLWRHYLQNIEGLIYVVDSTDRARLNEMREEFNKILESDDMDGVPVLVIANKQDRPDSISPPQMMNFLKLRKLTKRRWHCVGTCATNGADVYTALGDLADMVKQNKEKNKSFFDTLVKHCFS